jgi:DNA-directed RNA polymerase subunit RPC12/RpoP
MSKTVVRCRCGHQIVAKEVLRTDLYERSAGRDCVYIKYRCSRCKRMGQAFVAESRWDWSILDAGKSELNPNERDRFLDENPISAVELLNFHSQLQNISSLIELQTLQSSEPEVKDSKERESKEPPKDLRLRNPGERDAKERGNPERKDGGALGHNGSERTDDSSKS